MLSYLLDFVESEATTGPTGPTATQAPAVSELLEAVKAIAAASAQLDQAQQSLGGSGRAEAKRSVVFLQGYLTSQRIDLSVFALNVLSHSHCCAESCHKTKLRVGRSSAASARASTTLLAPAVPRRPLGHTSCARRKLASVLCGSLAPWSWCLRVAR